MYGSIRVVLGMDVTTEKMAQITPILAKLEGRAGTLDLQHFMDESNVIPFTADLPEDETNEQDGEDTSDEGNDEYPEDSGDDEDSEYDNDDEY